MEEDNVFQSIRISSNNNNNMVGQGTDNSVIIDNSTPFRYLGKLFNTIKLFIENGKILLILGRPGCSTLLRVHRVNYITRCIGKRKTIGTVHGETLLNGKRLEIDFKHIAGYVEQMRSIEHLGDALVGSLNTGVGISIEERKRLTIRLKLVVKQFISVIMVKNQKTLTSYFQRNGVRPCTYGENPAEYILEATGACISSGTTDVDWPTVWKHSKEYQDVLQELDNLKSKEALEIYTLNLGSGENKC
ncbi:hypothetical protein ACTA71_007352 [Dictyostelium dimigraforme]